MSCTTAKSSKKKEICFASKKGICTVLQNGRKPINANMEVCEGCSFFKTPKQYANDRLKYLNKEIKYLGLGVPQSKQLRSELLKMVQGDTCL